MQNSGMICIIIQTQFLPADCDSKHCPGYMLMEACSDVDVRSGCGCRQAFSLNHSFSSRHPSSTSPRHPSPLPHLDSPGASPNLFHSCETSQLMLIDASRQDELHPDARSLDPHPSQGTHPQLSHRDTSSANSSHRSLLQV